MTALAQLYALYSHRARSFNQWQRALYPNFIINVYRWPNEPSKTYSPERTQTKSLLLGSWTNPYFREPPHIPKPPTQWEHANETKFWLSLFIENRDLYRYIWDFFYNSSAYHTNDQETQILSITSCKWCHGSVRKQQLFWRVGRWVFKLLYQETSKLTVLKNLLILPNCSNDSE